jgi:hypothetical protein
MSAPGRLDPHNRFTLTPGISTADPIRPAAAAHRGAATSNRDCSAPASLAFRGPPVSRSALAATCVPANDGLTRSLRPAAVTTSAACGLFAQREAVASGDEMLVGAAKEVSAGASDHECCRILTAVRQSRIGRAALLGLVSNAGVWSYGPNALANWTEARVLESWRRGTIVSRSSAFASGLASERKCLTRRPCRRGRSSSPGRVKRSPAPGRTTTRARCRLEADLWSGSSWMTGVAAAPAPGRCRIGRSR